MTCTLCGSINHKTPDCAWRVTNLYKDKPRMKKYAVAVLSLHDGELKLEFVDAENKVDAAMSVMKWPNSDDYEKFSTLQHDAYDSDTWVEVKEIPT